MSSESEDDALWRAWMQALPSPEHPKPKAAATYLAAMHRALEARPASIDRVSRDTKTDLIQCLVLHQDMIAYELDLAVHQLESGSIGESIGNLARLVGTVSAEAKAVGAAAGILTGAERKRRLKHVAALEAQAIPVRKLLLLLRRMLIEAP